MQLNRQQRRRIEALGRRFADASISAGRDHATLVRIAAALVEADATVSGVTIVTPEGNINHIDADTLRRGGRA
jgi:hypothetical protein